MYPYILVVDDEAALLTLVRYNLEKAGFEIGEAVDGEEAMLMIKERRPDLILLDWMLPRIAGIEICRRIRRNTETQNLPVIMLTARGEEHDRIRGLNYGADDYIIKPFSPSELVARVRAVLRRLRPAFESEILEYNGISMNLAEYRVSRDGVHMKLAPTEFRLLRHFMEHPGRVFSREQLLDTVWGQEIYLEPRTVDVHVRRLRRTLNAGGKSDIIRTIRTAGYALDCLK